MTTANELKPCGCGGEPVLVTHPTQRCFAKACSQCHIRTDWVDSESEADDDWNRALSAPPPAVAPQGSASMECRACRGSGTRAVPEPTEEGRVHYVDCDRCGGTGEFPARATPQGEAMEKARALFASIRGAEGPDADSLINTMQERAEEGIEIIDAALRAPATPPAEVTQQDLSRALFVTASDQINTWPTPDHPECQRQAASLLRHFHITRREASHG